MIHPRPLARHCLQMYAQARELDFTNRQEDPDAEDPVQWQRCSIRELDEVVIRDTSKILSKASISLPLRHAG